jgi:glutathione synthase/RimK-type ligase-like ATP-grasp enzyme
MTTLVVVENPSRWPLQMPDVEVVSARDYLSRPPRADGRRTRVFNLCRSYRYQTLGYYVSLLATARGHRVLPSVATLQDLRSAAMTRVVSEQLDTLVQRSLATLRAEEFELSVYFGRNVAKRHDRLAKALFNAMPAPLLRATFRREEGRWRLETMRAIPVAEVPDGHHEFVIEQARVWLARGTDKAPPRRHRYDLAILLDPTEEEPPSNERSIRAFERAAAEVGIRVDRIGFEDVGRVAEYDALFVRATTSVDHPTYRIARRAAAEGLVVIDDPESIVRASSKIFLAEAFARAGVPAPKSVVFGRRDELASAVEQIGLPCVVKEPDSSFSRGVHKAKDFPALEKLVRATLERNELVLLQQFTPSTFDWRVGVLDGEPLYAARYQMSPGHWQVVRTLSDGTRRSGRVDCIDLPEVPEAVKDAAVRAAAVIGDGLYGVDLKQLEDGSVVVIEVNDNPSIDAGYEDRLLKASLYQAIMGSFRRRLDRARQHEAG